MSYKLLSLKLVTGLACTALAAAAVLALAAPAGAQDDGPAAAPRQDGPPSRDWAPQRGRRGGNEDFPPPPPPPHHDPETAFSDMDADSDGCVNLEEFKAFGERMRAEGPPHLRRGEGRPEAGERGQGFPPPPRGEHGVRGEGPDGPRHGLDSDKGPGPRRGVAPGRGPGAGDGPRQFGQPGQDAPIRIGRGERPPQDGQRPRGPMNPDAVFDSIDANNDGTVSREEFSAHRPPMGPPPGAGRGPRPGGDSNQARPPVR